MGTHTRTQTIDNKTFTTSFTYNDDNKLTSQTLASGKTIEYGYNAKGELQTISIDGTAYISDIKTNQNGLVSYKYADDTTHTRVYDNNGRVTKLIYPNYTEVVNYNKVNNITSIQSDMVRKAFGFDNLDRLTHYDDNTTKEYQNFSYDANGNRLTQNQETNKTRRFTYTENSNTLTGIKYYHTIDENTTNVTKDINYTYDKTGNIIADDKHSYSYDGRNRLTAIDSNVTYQYNYDNKRVSKTVNGVTTYYIYNEHMLQGEYDQNGDLIKEYVYNGSTPIAVLTPTTIEKIYADHLDTPRRVADNANNIIWKWESSPFGETKPTGTYTLNLRFPGQYFDSETETHYNINRDYNPVTGRYVQSDPIGFDGGYNTFGYVGGKPIIITDLIGLDWTWNIMDMEAFSFVHTVIRPTLEQMNMYDGTNFSGEAIEQLLLGTALQESGHFMYDRQIGYSDSSTGGAFGYYQLQKNLIDSLYSTSKMTRTFIDEYKDSSSSRLYGARYNLTYATMLTRVNYYRKSEIRNSLEFDNINQQASFWKRYHNTYSGGGTVSQYLDNWNTYVVGN